MKLRKIIAVGAVALMGLTACSDSTTDAYNPTPTESTTTSETEGAIGKGLKEAQEKIKESDKSDTEEFGGSAGDGAKKVIEKMEDKPVKLEGEKLDIFNGLWKMTSEAAKDRGADKDAIEEKRGEFEHVFGCIVEEIYDDLSADAKTHMKSGSMDMFNYMSEEELLLIDEAYTTCFTDYQTAPTAEEEPTTEPTPVAPK